MLARFAVRFCSTMTKTIENAASSSKSDAALHRLVFFEVESDFNPLNFLTVFIFIVHCRVQDGRVGDDSRHDQPKVRVKTNRYAMLLGYQGKNYFGMQV